MSAWEKAPFADILVESRDGEWGEGVEKVGYQLCEMIRGTDFANLNDQNVELPRRWIPDHLVERKKLQAGDIIFEMAGGTAKQSTGRSAILRDSFFEKHKNNPILCASFCRHLRLKNDRFNSQYIYFMLQALYDAGYMSVYNIQHTGVSRFQYTSFKKMTVLDIPPLATQKKIASILSAYDDLIENNQRRITLLEKMAEELYREWFVRLRFPGYGQAKFEKGVPVGWRAVSFSEICKFAKGKNPDSTYSQPVDAAIPYINVDTLENGANTYAIPAKNSVLSSDDDILMLMDGARSGLVFRGCLGIVGSTFALIRVEERLKNIVYEYLKAGKEAIVSNNTGSAIPHANKEFINRMILFLPNDDNLIERFDSLYKGIIQQRRVLELKNTVMNKTKISLLSRLISGKLSVESFDIHFPPSMRDVA